RSFPGHRAVLGQNQRGAVGGRCREASGVVWPRGSRWLAGLTVLTGRTCGRPSATSDARGAADEVTSGGASFVTMVQTADFPECDHVTLGDVLHASGRWRVFRQREMRARSVIIRKIAGQDSAQMLLAEYHHVVQAVAPN